MELGLSLGEAPKPFAFMEKSSNSSKGLEFRMDLGAGLSSSTSRKDIDGDEESRSISGGRRSGHDDRGGAGDHSPVQLDLLPLVPVLRPSSSQHRFPWPADNGNSDGGSSGAATLAAARGFDVNRLPSTDEIDEATPVDSPNSIASSFQMEISIFRDRIKGQEASAGAEAERAFSRASDEEDNALTRKKLRLSKEQSAFLEESFKEHNTLNPKQKLALAKQLNLRPRQVEVWFQNRRARTKLKQTEVDCEYLKKCCENLTEENRRLQKELQELRALKTSHPFYMQLPATTLSMCPSCERVAATTIPACDGAAKSSVGSPPMAPKPLFHPFSHQSTSS